MEPFKKGQLLTAMIEGMSHWSAELSRWVGINKGDVILVEGFRSQDITLSVYDVLLMRQRTVVWVNIKYVHDKDRWRAV